MRNGDTPAHLIPWAPSDYLTSRTRMRAIQSQDHMLRLVYREALDVLYAEGGSVALAALPDLTGLPADVVERAVGVCRELGSLAVDDGIVTNPRVTRTLERIRETREMRAAGGHLGGRPKSKDSRQKNLMVNDVNPPGIGIGIGIGIGKGNGKGSVADAVVSVLEHWQERAHTVVRSDKVRGDVLKRIEARMRDGFSADDLRRVVDVACADEFYVQRGYYKQPDVIFRNAERVQSLLARREAAAARPLPL